MENNPTQTNAQQRQVILELREIRKKSKQNKDQVFGVGMQGRSNMCLLARNNSEYGKGTSDELSRLCSREKKQAKSSKNKGCRYLGLLCSN